MNRMNSRSRSVSFDTVDVVEFAPAVGDNPSVSQGVPITLAKEPLKTTKLLVDAYESEREPRRPLGDLLLERSERETILLNEGYSKRDLAAATRQMRRIQDGRKHSSCTVRWDKLTETLEGTMKSCGRIVGLRQSSKVLLDTNNLN